MTHLRIRNWDRFQHYKKNTHPVWIKLHIELANDPVYHLMEPLAAKYLSILWLICCDTDGILPCLEKLAFRLRVEPSQIEGLIKAWDHYLEGDSRAYLEPLYTTSSDAIEQRRGEERREEEKKNKDTCSATLRRPKPSAKTPSTDPRVKVLGDQISDAYLASTGLPLGSQGRMRKNIKASIMAGMEPETILADYREYLLTTKGFYRDKAWGKFEGWRNERAGGKRGPTFISPQHRGDCGDIFGQKLP